jgi:hypothetical protein
MKAPLIPLKIGEESILYGVFAQIYEEYCSLAVLLVRITVNYCIKERNYKPSLNK